MGLLAELAPEPFESGAASYDFDFDWTTTAQPIPSSADVLHIGSAGAWLTPGADAVRALVRKTGGRATITFDPNIRPMLVTNPDETRERIEELAALADIVKLSDEDLRWLRPGEPFDNAPAAWLAGGAKLVVITLGSEGALAFTRDYTVHIAGTPTTVVDTVGAGDTFMATLLASLGDRQDLQSGGLADVASINPKQLTAVLRRCVDAAAITVARKGMNPAWRSELRAISEYIDGPFDDQASLLV
ncbi:PfkB family carbohydrate kinase [Agromyces binzhouensis]|uniref:PfkB family carbohydrate kinase n=1 Tax=Agromyces binzhouensis TaxID=1817495 RepID=UPI00364151F1